jgi:hypothetical protein
VLPARPVAGRPFQIGLSIWNHAFNGYYYFGSPPRIQEDRITIEDKDLTSPRGVPPSLAQYEYSGFLFDLPALSAGVKTVDFVVLGSVVASLSFTVTEPQRQVFLGDTCQVVASWRDAAGVDHQAKAVRLTAESASFSFFDEDNVELVVKILDGRALNGHDWVFAASMTDWPYKLTVTQYVGSICDLPISPPCPFKTYLGPAGVNRNVIDTVALRPAE